MAVSVVTPASNQRLLGALEWTLVVLLAGGLAWTTLCLGGYRPETMVVTSLLVVSVAGLACLLAACGAGRPWATEVWWPVPFLIFALANVLWISPVAWLAWREWLLWFQMWLVFAVALHFGRTRAQTGVLIGVALALAVASVAMAVYQRFVDWEWLTMGRKQLEQYRGRATGPFGIPNSLAAYLELIFFPCLAVALTRRVGRGRRAFCGAMAVVCAGGLVLSVSRGAMVALGGASLAWPLVGGGSWAKRLRGALLAAALVAVAFGGLYLAVPTVRERLRPFAHGQWEASRPVMWRAAWEIFSEHPWLGSGAASYNIEFERHRPAGFSAEPQWAHNDYLNVLSDYGVVGLALWLAAGGGLCVVAVRRFRSARASDDGAEAGERPWRFGAWLGLTAFALHLVVDFHLRIPALALWTAAATGLLLRGSPGASQGEGGRRTAVRVVWAVIAVAVVGWGLTAAVPVYRAEALRYGARQSIDENARSGRSDFPGLVQRADAAFARAVEIDPGNAQAWADLAYSRSLVANLTPGLRAEELNRLGREAEGAARRATALSGSMPEFRIRLGIALDMQGRQGEAEPCYRDALRLAPRTGNFWFYYAYHLSGIPGRADDARKAVDACLQIDAGHPDALALRERLDKAGRRP